MRIEISDPNEAKIVGREELVEYLKTKTDKDLQWDVETKRKIHEWIIQNLAFSGRMEVTDELGRICEEAGLHEEAQRQYKNAIDLAIKEENTEIEPLSE